MNGSKWIPAGLAVAAAATALAGCGSSASAGQTVSQVKASEGDYSIKIGRAHV